MIVCQAILLCSDDVYSFTFFTIVYISIVWLRFVNLLLINYWLIDYWLIDRLETNRSYSWGSFTSDAMRCGAGKINKLLRTYEFDCAIMPVARMTLHFCYVEFYLGTIGRRFFRLAAVIRFCSAVIDHHYRIAPSVTSWQIETTENYHQSSRHTDA